MIVRTSPANTFPGTFVSRGRHVRNRVAEEQPARLTRLAQVMGVTAGDPPIRIDVVVDAEDFLPRVVDRRRGREVAAVVPSWFGAGQSARSFNGVWIAQRRRPRSSGWSDRRARSPAAPSRSSRRGRGSLAAIPPRQKKNVLSLMIGPPTV